VFTKNPELLPAPLAEAARSQADFAGAVEVLRGRGLIQQSSGALIVHRLLAEAIRRPLAEAEQAAAAATVQVLLARRLRNTIETSTEGTNWRSLLPHVLTATGAEVGDRAQMSWLLDGAGSYLLTQGQPNAAYPLFEQALRLNEAAHGPDDPSVAAGLNNLAVTLTQQGRAADARPLLERALRIDQAAHGPDHSTVAQDLNNLATVLYQLGQPDEAQQLLRQALRIDEDRHGPNHLTVASDLNLLAEVYANTGQMHKARGLMERALRITEDARGPDHPKVVPDLRRLADMLHRLGEAAAARPLLERALRIVIETYGSDHPTARAVQDALDQLPEAAPRGLYEKRLSTRLRQERSALAGEDTE
jgi:tetratricopeptide (TPR) repeat protein